MGTRSYVGIDVSKDRLDIAVLRKERGWQVDAIRKGITSLVEQMQKLCPELIVVEATGGYQRAVAVFGQRVRYESNSEAGKQLSALLVRRRQLEEMLKAEQNRLRTVSPSPSPLRSTPFLPSLQLSSPGLQEHFFILRPTFILARYL